MLLKSFTKKAFALLICLSHGFLASGQIGSVRDSLYQQLYQIQDRYQNTNLDSALLRYNSIVTTAKQRQLPDVELYGVLCMAWASDAFMDLDRYDKYIAQCETIVLQQKKELDKLEEEHGVQAMLAFTSAMRHYSTGKFEEAIAAFNKLVLLEKDSLVIFSNYAYIGKSYFAIGNYDRAISVYEKSAHIIPKDHPNYQGILDHNYYWAINRSYLGEVHAKMALERGTDFGVAKAFSYFYTTKAIAERKKDAKRMKNMMITTYNRIASLHQQAKQYDSSLYYFKKSMRYHVPGDPEYINTNLLLGDVYLEMKQFDRSLEYYQRSLELICAKFSGADFRKGKVLYKIGDVYRINNELHQALNYYNQALENLIEGFIASGQNLPKLDSVGLNSANDVIAVLERIGDINYASSIINKDEGSLRKALATYGLAIALSERVRLYSSLHFKQYLSEKYAGLYERAARTSFELYKITSDEHQIGDTFAWIERNKSRLLLENAANLKAKHFSGIPDNILAEESNYRSNLNYVFEKWIGEEDPQVKEHLKIKQYELQEEYQKFVRQLELQYPSYYHLKYNPPIVTLEVVQQNLPEGGALLEFMQCDSSLLILLATKQKCTIRIIHKINEIDSLVNHIRVGCLKVNPPGLNEYCYALYSRLLEEWMPGLRKQNTTRLTIIPDGTLHYLPFELLQTSRASQTNSDNLPSYLIREFVINYQYSASLFMDRNPKKLNSSPRMLGFAPTFSMKKENQSTLYGARNELQYIESLIPGDYIYGELATKTRFKQIANGYKLLHLATHAEIDEVAELSRIIFASTDSISNTNLHLYELYNLSIESELVTLSACNTGLGRLQKGEGLMSLSRGFAYAGCPNVVTSLWPASDKSTEAIMSNFYEALSDGLDKDEALRQAKLKYLDQSDHLTGSPYFWAGFVFIGDPQKIELSSSRMRVFGWILLILLPFAALYIIRTMITWTKRG